MKAALIFGLMAISSTVFGSEGSASSTYHQLERAEQARSESASQQESDSRMAKLQEAQMAFQKQRQNAALQLQGHTLNEFPAGLVYNAAESTCEACKPDFSPAATYYGENDSTTCMVKLSSMLPSDDYAHCIKK